MSAFIEEVKRRKIYRVAVAHGVVAWLIAQIFATVFPAWDLPIWSLRLDAFDGPMITKSLAEIYALLGEQEKAIDVLDGLLSRPSFISVAMLKVIPIWDPLRNNPRFGELLRKYGGSV